MDGAKGKQILIAEDDPFISRMYQTKLIGAGFEVKMAANGLEAVTIIKMELPSLLLLDLDMPEMTGFQALEELVAAAIDLSAMPVIILTNSSKSEDRERAKGFGAEYLVKADITPKQVLDKINSKLDVSGEPNA